MSKGIWTTLTIGLMLYGESRGGPGVESADHVDGIRKARGFHHAAGDRASVAALAVYGGRVRAVHTRHGRAERVQGMMLRARNMAIFPLRRAANVDDLELALGLA